VSELHEIQRGSRPLSPWRIAALFALLAACGRPPAFATSVHHRFWNSIRDLCGQSFQGRVVEATRADSALVGRDLVLDVWQCYPRELQLAFHVDDDASRVWLLESTTKGLRLSHELHAQDETELPFSGYGGETRDAGTATAQRFHPDAETLADVPSAAASVWTIEVVPGDHIAYVFDRAAGRFRLEFDLTSHAAGRPSPPWGFSRRRGPGAGS
jgi:hypothetical protein